MTALWSVILVFAGYSQVMQRIIAASAILTSCGSLALVVLAWLTRREEAPSKIKDINAITLVCPRCRCSQSIVLGGANCADCGLKIEVRVTMPACKQCSHPLDGTETESCPECGTPL